MENTEVKRLKRSKTQLINVLRDRGENGITNKEFAEIGFLRYGGLLGVLYKEGYKISKKSLGNGLFNYTLIEEPKEKVLRQSAYEMLSDHIRSNTKSDISAEAIKELCEKAGVSLRVKAGTYQ